MDMNGWEGGGMTAIGVEGHSRDRHGGAWPGTAAIGMAGHGTRTIGRAVKPDLPDLRGAQKEPKHTTVFY
jgi:hypothetical protein